LLIRKYSSASIKFGAENLPILGEFGGKIEVCSTRDILSEMCICWKIVTSFPTYFFDPDATVRGCGREKEVGDILNSLVLDKYVLEFCMFWTTLFYDSNVYKNTVKLL